MKITTHLFFLNSEIKYFLYQNMHPARITSNKAAITPPTIAPAFKPVDIERSDISVVFVLGVLTGIVCK